MGIRGEIYTGRLAVDTKERTYFFNVKENRKGDVFLVLAESVVLRGDTAERQQIVVYEEHLDDFRYELNKAVAIMRKKSSPKKRERKLSSF